MAPEHDHYDTPSDAPIVDGEVVGVVTPSTPSTGRQEIPHTGSLDVDTAAHEREASHASMKPTGIPYCYTNCDVTVTVDPMKNQMWTRDDATYWKTEASYKRGAVKDHYGVLDAVKHLDPPQETPTTFLPTSAMIDKMDKWTSRCVNNSTRGWDRTTRMYSTKGDRPGKLPVHTAAQYAGMLVGKTDWRVENDFWWANTHGDRNRAFDCEGNCR